MIRTPALLALLVLPVATGAAAQSAPVAVMVGGDADLDACGGLGRVHGLDPSGDNFLSVRAAPAARAQETDRLRGGEAVHVCEARGRWLGVVYGGDACGVSGPIERRGPYRGDCRSGWVFEDFVEIEAG